MEKKSLTIGLIIILVLGALFLGYIFGQSQIQPQTGPGAFELLNSKLVRDINVSVMGKITNISDKTITIEDSGASLDLAIPEQISVMRQPVASEGKSVPPAPEQIKLEDLKVGDSVNANILLDNSGKTLALIIVVLPEPLPSPSPAPAE